MNGVKSAKLAISKGGTFDPVRGIWKCWGLDAFIWSAINVPLLNFFDNVTQSLQNPEFVSILGKKWIFSKGHPYSIFKLVY
jgi:hypothetical protein